MSGSMGTSGRAISAARRTVLVTGASSGIGKELARVFAREGYDLVLAARNRAALEELARELSAGRGNRVEVVKIDLSRPGSAADLFAATGERGIVVDVLVNNAGFSVSGAFLSSDAAALREMLELNMASLTELMKLYLPGMTERRRGGIINLASVGSFFPTPFSAGYCASKAYVLSLSEAIAEELAGTGVTVTALCPGPTRTGFAARAGIESAPVFKRGAMDARTVAEIAYRGFIRGKRVVIPGLMNRLMVFSGRFAPRALAAKIAGTMMRGKSP